MPTVERLEVGITPIGAEVIKPRVAVISDWRQDARLAESFGLFEFFFRKSEQGDKIIPSLRLPTFYVTLAIRLAEQWSDIDKNIYPIGIDTQGRTDFAFSLYRNGRDEHIATVFPHAQRNDQIVMVHSLEQASDFFQLLFEAKQKEEESWKVVIPENIYALDPQGKVIKWPERLRAA